MELHELHVLQRQAGADDHGVAVAGAGVSARAGEIGAAEAARGHDCLFGANAMDAAVLEGQGHHAAADAVVHDEVEREVLDEEFGGIAQRLAVERVQHGVARAVGGGAGALGGRAFAELGGHAAEGALIDLAVVGAAEGHAVMLKLIHGGRRVAAQIFDGVLIAEPVGPLHGVVHVPAPIVLAHIAQRGRDAALGRHRVRARREHLGDAGRLQSRFRAA